MKTFLDENRCCTQKEDQEILLPEFVVSFFAGLGLLIGIVLLVYAIFVFRKIKLVLLILLTMAGGYGIMKLDSAHLRHEMLYGKDSENEYSLLARSELDDIVRNLELYRLRYQRYPDSLKQLEKENPKLFIIDPLQARNHARDPITYKFIYFYYIPQDTTYELFSAGVDGMPHTKDDIYPQRPLNGANNWNSDLPCLQDFLVQACFNGSPCSHFWRDSGCRKKPDSWDSWHYGGNISSYNIYDQDKDALYKGSPD